MSYRILEWDSAHFGFPIARLDSLLDEEGFEKFEIWLKKSGVRCVYLLTKADSSDSAWALKRGFAFQDIRVTLDRTVREAAPLPAGTRLCERVDVAKLVERGSELFEQSRFFCDKRFPRSRSKAMYEIWIEKSCAPSNSQITIVTGPIGDPTGFVTCDITEDGKGHIGLYGSFGEPGLGQRLLAHAAAWFLEKKTPTIYVVTQGSAIHAQRSYQKAGFRTKSLEFWFHRWF